MPSVVAQMVKPGSAIAATWADARSTEEQGRAQVMNSAAKADSRPAADGETGHDGKIWFTFSIRKFQPLPRSSLRPGTIGRHGTA